MRLHHVLALASAAAALGACQRDGRSVNDAYALGRPTSGTPSTDAASPMPPDLGPGMPAPALNQLFVRVRIDYGAAALAGVDPRRDLQLRAYRAATGELLPLSGLAKAPDGSTSLTLTQGTQDFELAVQLPPDEALPDGGLAVRFVASAVALPGAAVPPTQLETLALGLERGTREARGQVTLTPASSVVVALARTLRLSSQPPPQAWASLLLAADSIAAAVAAQSGTGTALDLDTYALATHDAILAHLVQSAALQAQLFEGLEALPEDGSSSTDDALSVRFADAMLAYATQILAAAQDSGSCYARAYAPSASDLSGLSAAAAQGALAFAPSSIEFTDSDASSSLAGTLTLQPALRQDGVVGYRVYMGGSARAEARRRYLDDIALSDSMATTFSGVGTDPSIVQFWVFPLLTDGTELEAAATAPIQNLNAPSVPAPGAFDITSATQQGRNVELRWSHATNVSDYSVFRGHPADRSSYPIKDGAPCPYVNNNVPPNRELCYLVTAYGPGGITDSTTQARVVTGPWVSQLDTPAYETHILGIAPGPDGHVYVTGSTGGVLAGSRVGVQDAFVASFGGTGTLLWAYQFGAPGGTVTSNKIAVTPDGIVLVTGTTDSSLGYGGAQHGLQDAYLARIDPSSGAPLWILQTGLSGQTTRGVALDADNEFVAWLATTDADLVQGAAGSSDRNYLAVLNLGGAQLAQTQFTGSDGPAAAYDVAMASGHQPVVVGGLDATSLNGQPRNGTRSAYAQMFSADLTSIVWTQVLGSSGIASEDRVVRLDATGSIYTLGSREAPEGRANLIVHHYGTDGSVLAELLIGNGSASLEPGGIAISPDGDIFVAASTDVGLWGQPQRGSRDHILAKLSAGGGFYWARQTGGPGAEVRSAGVVLSDTNQAVVAGTTSAPLGPDAMAGTQDGFVSGLLQTPID